jgi:hypothetical protein
MKDGDRPSGFRRDAWRRAAALAAVLLLVASSALIFARISSRGQTAHPITTRILGVTPTATAGLPGNWAEAIPKQSTIQDIAIVSRSDIWAAGLTGTDHGIETLLMHYDGMRWQISPDTVDGAELYSISMVSAVEGWAAGSINQTPLMLHYTQGHWRNATDSIDVTSMADHKLIVTSVRMATATSGWAIGVGDQAPQPANQILQYLKVGGGYRWEPTVSIPGATLLALSVVSNHEAWIVGHSDQNQRTIILRITAKYLNNDPTSVVANWTTTGWDVGKGSLVSVAMRSSTDGWVGGADISGNGTLFHWDGQRWSAVNFQPAGQPSWLVAGAIQGIVLNGPNGLWVFGLVGASKESFLVSMAGGHWFTYDNSASLRILMGTAYSPTKLLAITRDAYDDSAPQALTFYDTRNGSPVAGR